MTKVMVPAQFLAQWVAQAKSLLVPQVYTPEQWDAFIAQGLPAIQTWAAQPTPQPPAKEKPASTAPVAAPKGLVGAMLKTMLASWGTPFKPGCPCESKARAMNELGIAGCRKNL